MTGFVLASVALAILALCFLLIPVLRNRRGRSVAGSNPQRKALKDAYDAGVLTQAEYETKLAALPASTSPEAPTGAEGGRAAKIVVWSIVVALPLAAFALYRTIGRPDAVSQSPKIAAPGAMPQAAPNGAKPSMDMGAAIGSLRAKLEKNPNDADGWLLLGRAYESVGRNDDGRKALQKAYELAPDQPAIEIAYAESIALTSPTRRIDGKSLEMIRHAMKADPQNQDGLWLLGMSDYQNGRYAEAIASWEKIRVQLGPDSDVLESVTNMIDDAKAHQRGDAKATAPGSGVMPAGAMPAAAMPAASGASVAGANGPKLQVRVALAAGRKDSVAPNDTVFVFAKAVGGPPMPVAIRRLKASELPTTIDLTDGDAMMPTMRLSNFDRVTVSARVSKSGDAAPKPGDLQADAVEVETKRGEAISLSIDRVVR